VGYFSFKDNRCGLCRKTFEKDGALEQHVSSVHKYLWWKVSISVLLVLLGGGFYYYYAYVRPSMTIDPANYDGAVRGEHWHARYSVEVCGETKQPFMYSQGDIHTHGKGRIHIHPHSSATEGPKMNLKSFIESANGTMTDTSLVIPLSGIDSTKECNGKPSEFVVYVNGYRVENPTEYTPQDGDTVGFVIQPQSKGANQ